MPVELALLTYTYVEDMAARREPHRDDHLALIARMQEEGRLLVAGAVGAPPTGAAIGFRDREAAEEFAAADPYGAAGLVVESRIEPWTVVAGLGA